MNLPPSDPNEIAALARAKAAQLMKDLEVQRQGLASVGGTDAPHAIGSPIEDSSPSAINAATAREGEGHVAKTWEALDRIMALLKDEE